jgi:cysteine desulfurase
MDFIYLDNNSTTPMLPAVWEAMRPFATEFYGNPASAHRVGSHARRALEDAREQIAAILHSHADEVIFTSGATEANNLAVFGLAGDPPGAILTSPIEHPSVAEPIERLAQLGFRVERLPVARDGVMQTETFAHHLHSDTRLVSLMLANHETGALQPVADAARQLEDRRISFHCDATQAVGKMPVDFHELAVTTLALSAHKFHGPKGTGALLLRRGAKLRPQLWGGHQQRGQRPGTEPVALAVGMATALALWHKESQARTHYVCRLRQQLLGSLQTSAAPVVVNGPANGAFDRCLPHTLNLSFPGCRSDSLLMNLDLAGIACSTGSACSSGSLLPSPVLQAMAVPAELLHSAMRFSLSPLNTEQEIIEAARRIAEVVARLRQL